MNTAPPTRAKRVAVPLRWSSKAHGVGTSQAMRPTLCVDCRAELPERMR